MKETTLTRSKLYSLIWERPMTNVAADFGISANGLKKICIKHSIPRPPAGYFLMATERRRPASPWPMPHPDHDPEIKIVATEKPAAEIIDINDLVTPSRIDPEISRCIDEYIKAMRADPFVDERKIIRPKYRRTDALIRCSESKLSWCAYKLKAILSTLQANGCRVEFRADSEATGKDNLTSAEVHFDRGSISLRVEETSTRRPRPLTAAELKDQRRHNDKGWTYYIRDQWIYTPTGKPQLIFGYWNRRQLADDIRPLTKILLMAVKRDHESEIQHEIDERHRRAMALMELRPLRHAIWKKRQLKAIENEAELWERAERLRRYVSHIAGAPSNRDVTGWLTLAQSLINSLDPVTSGTYARRVKLPKYAEVQALRRRTEEDY